MMLNDRKLHAQAIFNEVVEHLIRQGCQSVRGDGSCMYRGPDGLKCAVGALIRDEEYAPWMEHRTACDLAQVGGLPARLMPHVLLLRELQFIHDKSPSCWWGPGGLGAGVELLLRKLAIRHELDASVLDREPAHV